MARHAHSSRSGSSSRSSARNGSTLLTLTLTLLIATASPAAADIYNCREINVGSEHYDLSLLSSPARIADEQSTPPTKTKTEISLDLCKALPKDEHIPQDERCPDGSFVCIVIRNIKEGTTDRVTQVIAPAAEVEGKDIKWEAATGDKAKGGERELILSLWGYDYVGKVQKTRVTLSCDHDAAKDSHPQLVSYDRADGDLKLIWASPYACPTKRSSGGKDHVGGGGDSSAPIHDESGGWGFFSWFFFLVSVLFVGYFAVGAYTNYQQYGATGWDLVPNKDFWREAPYIARDVGKEAWRSVSGRNGGGGGGSRGAYEQI